MDLLSMILVFFAFQGTGRSTAQLEIQAVSCGLRRITVVVFLGGFVLQVF